MLSGSTGELLWIQISGKGESIGHCVDRIADVDDDGIADFFIGIIADEPQESGARIIAGKTGYVLKRITPR
jgi:hypothetical protein